jgi:hypothetical protein
LIFIGLSGSVPAAATRGIYRRIREFSVGSGY